MDWLMNIVLPVVGGIVGSTVTIFWTEIKSKETIPYLVKWRYSWIGGISGFVAVNLLNPNGHLSEKLPLAILAGISPMSFLKGQAISDGKEEGEIFQDCVDNVEKYTEMFDKEIEIPEDSDDITEIVNKVKKEYNSNKGDEENE